MSCGNETNCTPAATDGDHRVLLPHFLREGSAAACVLILVIGVLGNLLVPYVICRTRDLRSSTYLLLINLCVADLLVLVVCMPTVLLELLSRPEVWELGAFMCKVVPYLELTVAHGSIFTILAISFERYYAICRPLKAMTTCTKPRATSIVLGIWLSAIVLTSPVLVISNFEHVPHIDGGEVPACLTPADTGTWQKTYFVAISVAFFWLPLLILIFLYAIITRHLMTKERLLRQGSRDSNSRMRSRKQVVAMLTCVIVCFFTCLMPFRVFTLWLLLSSPKHVQSLGVESYYTILYFCRVMLYVNSAVNPVLYNLISSKFRNALIAVLLCRANNRTLSRRGTSSLTCTSSSSQMHNNTRNGLLKSFQPVTLTAATPAAGKRITAIKKRLSIDESAESCL